MKATENIMKLMKEKKRTEKWLFHLEALKGKLL